LVFLSASPYVLSHPSHCFSIVVPEVTSSQFCLFSNGIPPPCFVCFFFFESLSLLFPTVGLCPTFLRQKNRIFPPLPTVLLRSFPPYVSLPSDIFSRPARFCGLTSNPRSTSCFSVLSPPFIGFLVQPLIVSHFSVLILAMDVRPSFLSPQAFLQLFLPSLLSSFSILFQGLWRETSWTWHTTSCRLSPPPPKVPPSIGFLFQALLRFLFSPTERFSFGSKRRCNLRLRPQGDC